MPAHHHRIVREDVDAVLEAPLPWEELKNRRILIAGAGSFISSYVVRILIGLNDKAGTNCKVIGLVRRSESIEERYRDLAGRSDLAFLVQDVAEPVPAELEAADYVIHAASQASPKYFGSDPLGTLRANVLGTLQLLEFARRSHSRKLVLLSSSEVYGGMPGGIDEIVETTFQGIDPATVRACYAESKRMAETMCVAAAHQHGVRASMVRLFHTYGPGMRLDDGRIFADLVADVVQGRPIELHSDGSAKRSFCYVRDAANGILTVLLKGDSGVAYNLGNPKAEISVIDLANLLVGLFPERKIEVRTHAQGQPSGYLPSPVSRIQPGIGRIAGLGWRPEIGLAEGFRRTIESYL